MAAVGTHVKPYSSLMVYYAIKFSHILGHLVDPLEGSVT